LTISALRERTSQNRKAKLKTIRNAKVIRMKHQIGLTGLSFNPHHFIFKKEGRF